MSIVSLRPTHVLHARSDMVSCSGDGSLAPAAGGEQLWSYIDVRDVGQRVSSGGGRRQVNGIKSFKSPLKIMRIEHSAVTGGRHAFKSDIRSFPDGWDQSLSSMDCSPHDRSVRLESVCFPGGIAKTD